MQTLPPPHLGRETVSIGPLAQVQQIKAGMRRENDNEENIATNMETTATTK